MWLFLTQPVKDHSLCLCLRFLLGEDRCLFLRLTILLFFAGLYHAFGASGSSANMGKKKSSASFSAPAGSSLVSVCSWLVSGWLVMLYLCLRH